MQEASGQAGHRQVGQAQPHPGVHRHADGAQGRLHRSRQSTAAKFTIHILAAVAEHERDAISARTKAALAAVKARRKRLGNYQRIGAAKQRATAVRAEAVRPAIAEAAHLSARAAADELNRRDVETASGKQWHAVQIIHPRDRLDL